MVVDDGRVLEICCLVLACLILVSDLEHAFITSYGKVGAVYIDPLTHLVVVVEAVLSDLDLYAACRILDIEALVDVSCLVRCDDLSLDDAVLCDVIWLVAVVNVHLLHLCNRSELAEVFIGIDLLRLRIRVVALEHHRLELLASCEERRRCQYCYINSFHNFSCYRLPRAFSPRNDVLRIPTRHCEERSDVAIFSTRI